MSFSTNIDDKINTSKKEKTFPIAGLDLFNAFFLGSQKKKGFKTPTCSIHWIVFFFKLYHNLHTFLKQLEDFVPTVSGMFFYLPAMSI